MNSIYDELVSCPLFSAFSAEELSAVLTQDLFIIETFKKGEIVRTQGDKYEALMILLQGKLNARFHEYSGKTMLVETLAAPDPIAAGVLFSDVNYLPVTTEAVGDVKIITIKRIGILKLFQVNETMLRRFLMESGSKVVFLAEKVRLAGLANLRQKISDYLLRMRDQFSCNEFTIPYTREKMAELLSVARPSLSRELSKMVDESLIDLDGRKVRILEPEELQDTLMSL